MAVRADHQECSASSAAEDPECWDAAAEPAWPADAAAPQAPPARPRPLQVALAVAALGVAGVLLFAPAGDDPVQPAVHRLDPASEPRAVAAAAPAPAAVVRSRPRRSSRPRAAGPVAAAVPAPAAPAAQSSAATAVRAVAPARSTTAPQRAASVRRRTAEAGTPRPGSRTSHRVTRPVAAPAPPPPPATGVSVDAQAPSGYAPGEPAPGEPTNNAAGPPPLDIWSPPPESEPGTQSEGGDGGMQTQGDPNDGPEGTAGGGAPQGDAEEQAPDPRDDAR